MTDPETPLTPEQEARVRRLLAQARVEGPIPADVAARLDGVLAGLQRASERPQPESSDRPAAVVDLAARRRRRASGLLVAAAAVVAVGLGVGQLVKADNDTHTAGANSEADAAAESSLTRNSAPAAENDLGAPEAGPDTAPTQGILPPPQDRIAVLPRVSSQHFRRDISRLRSRADVRVSPKQSIDPEDLSSDPRFMCEAAAWGEGRLLAVLYDQLPAVVAYRPAQGRTQAVELLQCGSGALLRSTVIATRSSPE